MYKLISCIFRRNLSKCIICFSKCQEEILAMEKTSTANVSKECLETDLDKDMNDSDCKYTEHRW